MPKKSHAKSSKKRAKKKVLPLTQENVKLMEDYNKKLEKKISLLQLRADLSKEMLLAIKLSPETKYSTTGWRLSSNNIFWC